MPTPLFRRPIALATAAALGVGVMGCTTTDPYGNTRPVSQTAQGAGVGAAAGAVAGALIGSLSADAGRGALIGAVGGALAGAAVGHYMEQQRADFQRVLADEIARGVIRVEPLPGDRLLVSMTSATAFDVDSARIQPGFYSTMDKIADIVNRYGKTQLAVAGHTDNTGSAEHNMVLSRQRAEAVKGHLLGERVLPERISAQGYGFHSPVASNATAAGRTLNRRVEIAIVPIVAS